jgi:hypothetical protein
MATDLGDPGLEENYDNLVASGDRSYADIAKFAEDHNSPTLAEWAKERAGSNRAKAAKAGEDVNGKTATAKPKSTRSKAPAKTPAKPKPDEHGPEVQADGTDPKTGVKPTDK